MRIAQEQIRRPRSVEKMARARQRNKTEENSEGKSDPRLAPDDGHKKVLRISKPLVTCVRASEQNLADLLDVIGIVARHMSDQIPNRDPATLGMNPKALPLLQRELLQEL